MAEGNRLFIGKEGKYKIPHGTVVRLIKCWSRRKCLIEWENGQDISMVSLLRKIKEAS